MLKRSALLLLCFLPLIAAIGLHKVNDSPSVDILGHFDVNFTWRHGRDVEFVITHGRHFFNETAPCPAGFVPAVFPSSISTRRFLANTSFRTCGMAAVWKPRFIHSPDESIMERKHIERANYRWLVNGEEAAISDRFWYRVSPRINGPGRALMFDRILGGLVDISGDVKLRLCCMRWEGGGGEKEWRREEGAEEDEPEGSVAPATTWPSARTDSSTATSPSTASSTHRKTVTPSHPDTSSSWIEKAVELPEDKEEETERIEEQPWFMNTKKPLPASGRTLYSCIILLVIIVLPALF